MTRQPTLKIGILAAFVLLIGALIVVSAFAAPAQQVGTGQPSAKSSAQSVHPAQPAVDGAGRVAANYLQGKRHDARIMTPDNSLSFLPAVTYCSLDPASTSVAVADVKWRRQAGSSSGWYRRAPERFARQRRWDFPTSGRRRQCWQFGVVRDVLTDHDISCGAACKVGAAHG
jgi:hypothetical protein